MHAKNFIHKVVFKKFEIKKMISSSPFSFVYEGINLINNTPVALKMEKEKLFNHLESEAFTLMNLKGYGIPQLISYGKRGSYNILIEELLGPNIEFLWEKYGFKKELSVKNNITLKDICLIAIQILERLQYIHDKDMIHCDIKPKNFVIGRNNPKIIYLIDFGLAKKFRSSKTGKHVRFANKYKLIGTFFFSSCNAIKGYELSRRDDLESLGYALLYLANGLWLP